MTDDLAAAPVPDPLFPVVRVVQMRAERTDDGAVITGQAGPLQSGVAGGGAIQEPLFSDMPYAMFYLMPALALYLKQLCRGSSRYEGDHMSPSCSLPYSLPLSLSDRGGTGAEQGRRACRKAALPPILGMHTVTASYTSVRFLG